MEEITKTRFRFTDEFDLHLAREIFGQNPYEDQRRWCLIQVNMLQITGKSISVRTLKDRIQNLIKKHVSKTKLTEGQSGIEESVTELDDLIQQIIELIKEFKNQKKPNETVHDGSKVTEAVKSSFQLGFEAREISVSHMQKGNTDTSIEDVGENIEIDSASVADDVEYQPQLNSTADVGNDAKKGKLPRKRSLAQANILSPSVRKRTSTNIRESTVQYLSKKNDRQVELRSRELALAERRQTLEERKFQLETEERRKKMELEERRLVIDEKRLNVQLEVFKNQQELMKIILDRFS
ncbi:unnamed protein product [Diabrotica balteata]|uniref:Uncharacterized protein n=1 Tax=Diabrotica balteata TaxID=107213 RepID=A0A9N9XDW1_DIABA|nr:unnamed protein product [Diabrotica balteata]